jgi:thermitase
MSQKKLVQTFFLFSFSLCTFAQTAVPGRLLVGFKANVSNSNADSVIRSMGARSSRQLGDLPIHAVELPPTANANAFANAFRGRPEVEFTEPDMYLAPVQVTPNDPYYSSQWHLTKIQAPTAWTYTKGTSLIKIAILDTGVDSSHADLAARMLPGWNTYNNNSDSRDIHGHGTKVAGTASASSNNSMGGAAVSWETLIMPIRVTDTAGYATYSTLATGLSWSADRGARVANISFDVTGSATVSSAAQYFQNKGGVVFSSAGNTGLLSLLAPSPYITSVSATDQNDQIYSWSTFGSRVTLSAPGCVFTTYRGSTYGTACGTSFASPIAAGVAALVLSRNPNLTPSQVTSILRSTADDRGLLGLDQLFGYGRVNAAKAVQAAGGSTPLPPPPTVTADTTKPTILITSPSSGSAVNGSVTVQFSASDNKAVTQVSLLVNGTVVGSSTSTPFSINWGSGRMSSGTYTLQGRALDAAGNVGLSPLVTVYR